MNGKMIITMQPIAVIGRRPNLSERCPKSGLAKHERLAATVACKAAVKAGDVLAPSEMRALFVALSRTTLPAHDVHGRSTIVQVVRDVQIDPCRISTEQLRQRETDSAASEDFAFMLQRVPGCYFFVGNGALGTPGGCMVHNPGYDFNDDLIADGATFWSALVSDYLPVTAA